VKIGIYGGSFNPIHIGHTSLAQSLVNQGLVDEVWLLVSPLNPLKASGSDIADYSHRLRMAELACREHDGLRVSDFESRLPVPSYTVVTLNALSDAYPQHDFSLVIGADNWQSFDKWYKHDEILENFSLLVYNRPGVTLTGASSLPRNVQIVDTPLYDISSTEIRKSIRHGKCLTQWLSPEVADYIGANGLYR
jgi:nicotinate-nucleotide adenylyltransferase